MISSASPILALMMTKGVGTKTLSDIVDELHSIDSSMDELEINDIADRLGWTNSFRDSVLKAQEQSLTLILELDSLGVQILVRGCTGYPSRLSRVLGPKAPPVLFAIGNCRLLECPSVGFSGSRNASEKGLHIAREAAIQLSKRGVNVVSGYAKGVDLNAHVAGLLSGGTTTIVLAEGIKHFRAKSELKRLLTSENYVVISEFLPSIPWSARQAMQRNQTIIGLTDAMMVVESGETGGTFACGESTLQLNHPLYVVEYANAPESAAGNNLFLKKGAHPIRSDKSGQPNLCQLLKSVLGEGTRTTPMSPESKSTVTETSPVHNPAKYPVQVSSHDTIPAYQQSEPQLTQAKYPKRLIEVDLPIARISAHARAEKDSRLGHIPRLHIYPAARPVAACRSVLCAALWPDPLDETCPIQFREAVASSIKAFASRVVTTKISEEGHRLSGIANCSPESLLLWERIAAGEISLGTRTSEDCLVLRMCLLNFIAEFANWNNANESAFLETSRNLTNVAHECLGGVTGTMPIVLDPFAGGGAIPLEASRIGAEAFASDLNPVAILINKVVLTYTAKYGEKLIEKVRDWLPWAQERAKEKLARFYPVDADGAVSIAYLFARTAACEGPNCGSEIPLIRSLWLAKKNRVAVRLVPDKKNNRVEIEIVHNVNSSDVKEGTVKRGSATCPLCGFTTPAARVRDQLSSRRGGASDARLYCVVTTNKNSSGRGYRSPTKSDFEAITKAKLEFQKRKLDAPGDFPFEPTPRGGGRGAGRAFSQQSYGMTEFADLFNERQLLALSTYAKLAFEYSEKIAQSDKQLAEAVNACLALVVNRLADLNASLCGWQLSTPNTAHVFVRWALQLIWDYGEVNPLAAAGGSPESVVRRMLASLEHLSEAKLPIAHAQLASAQAHPLPDDSVQAFVTDPPYYDAVPYADILDFFYVWMKRSLRERQFLLLSSELTPKDPECIVDDAKGKTPDYFEATISECFKEGRRVLAPNGIGIVVFAHKSTASWERLIQALVDAGWTITSSWPIDTEMGSRLRARDSAALASSVHLVCRPREREDGHLTTATGEWREVLDELPKRIHEWMPRLTAEGVVGADAIFACLGPALEIYSRYSRVEKSNGELATLSEYLEFVWGAVSTEALSLIFQDADASGLEPDSRLTAMWLWTIGGSNAGDVKGGVGDSDDADVPDLDNEEPSKATAGTSGFSLEFDAARKIAQGLGIHLEHLQTLVEVKGGKARLLPVVERTQHLFGKNVTGAVGSRRSSNKLKQKTLFEELDEAEAAEDGWTTLKGPPPGSTTLDRVHQAMILFAANRGELLKRFLVDDGVGNDSRFWKLADNLNKLYPIGTDERRWVEGVLTRKKGLGF